MAQLGMETEEEDGAEKAVPEKKNDAKVITGEADVPRSKAEVKTRPVSDTTTESKKESGTTLEESTPPPKKDKDAEMKPLLKQVVAANTSQKKPVDKDTEKDEEKESIIDSKSSMEERDEVAA